MTVVVFSMMVLAMIAVTIAKLNTISKFDSLTSKISPTIELSNSQCFLKVTCQGQILDHNKAHNISTCMDRCQENPMCHWSSFDHRYHFCTQLSTCISNKSCEFCLTSARDCQIEAQQSAVSNFHRHSTNFKANNSSCNIVGQCQVSTFIQLKNE